MTTHQIFWDKMAPGYAKRPVADMLSYDQTMEATRAYLNTEDRALELGCGTGTTALRLHASLAHLTATDISGEMIEIANRKRAEQGVENVTFTRASIGEAGQDGPYDTILAFNLLHLIDDLPAALAEISAMVKPGGLFISKSACLAEKGWFLRPVLAVLRLIGKVPFVSFLKRRDLEGQITASGFKVIETRSFPGIAASRFIVARKL